MRALDDVSIDVSDGEVVGLIGPNGAGKTTLLNVLAGWVKPTAGEVGIRGQDVTHVVPYARARLGFARTYQSVQLFKDLSVREHLVVASQDGRPGTAGDRPVESSWRERLRLLATSAVASDELEEVLAVTGLRRLRDVQAGRLPLGLARMLEFARCLAQRPHVMALDEPASGMDATETARFVDVVARTRERFGFSVLIIEHDMDVIMSLCDRIYVLEFGKLMAHGTPAEIRTDPAVIAAYLGEDLEEEGTHASRTGS
jgi:ABC-type branched-subunit amino acid transport system ATPase component